MSVNTDGTGGAAALSDGGPHGIGISIGSDTTSPSHISNYAKTMAREAAFAFGITGVSPTNTVRTISKLANDGGVVGPSNVVVGPDGRVADNTDESLLGDLKVGWRAFSESLMNNIAGTTNQQSTTAADNAVANTYNAAGDFGAGRGGLAGGFGGVANTYNAAGDLGGGRRGFACALSFSGRGANSF